MDTGSQSQTKIEVGRLVIVANRKQAQNIAEWLDRIGQDISSHTLLWNQNLSVDPKFVPDYAKADEYDYITIFDTDSQVLVEFDATGNVFEYEMVIK